MRHVNVLTMPRSSDIGFPRAIGDQLKDLVIVDHR
jgi:hypothetical protein